MKGSTYRRCSCRDEAGKQLGTHCPKLVQRRHGVWYLRQELPAAADGTRKTLRKGGYETKTDAVADLDRVRALIGIPDEDDAAGRAAVAELLAKVVAEGEPLPDFDETARRFRSGLSLVKETTVGEWLDQWLSQKRVRKSAVTRYEIDIRLHLKPHLGHHKLSRLRISHISAMFSAIDEQNEATVAANEIRRQVDERRREAWARKAGRAEQLAIVAELRALPPFKRVTGLATQHRIKATLRAALSDAISEQLITFNPAAHVDLDPAKPPKALIWTEQRIALWRETGEKPSPVMVWTPAQTGTFLDSVAEHRLYPLFHLVAFCGLRRGEACGLRLVDVDLKGAKVTVAKQLIQDGWKIEEGDPKTGSSEADVALDAETVEVLKTWLAARTAEKERFDTAWLESGRFFVREGGEWLHPGLLTEEFERLVERSSLPPIRLHDLRHGAATIALAAGTDMKVISGMLRHSNTKITADTYTSVLPEVAYAAAEASAKLVPRARRGTPGLTPGSR
jgi:integrase